MKRLIRGVILLVLFFTLTVMLLTTFKPQLKADRYIVYHRPISDTEFALYIKDVQHRLPVNISNTPCAHIGLPDSLTGSTPHYLSVVITDNQLAVQDNLWGTRCEF